MKQYCFAIIGCGKIAPRHAAEAVKHGKLVAVCDIIGEKANTLAEAYGARSYTSITALLENEKEIDVLAICSPNGLHAEHAMLALRSGINVLCEKPLCIRVADADKMIRVAAEQHQKLFVVKSTRYNPALVELKNKIASGEFGKLYSFQLNCFWNRPDAYYKDSWKGKLEHDGGTLFTQFSHYIDAMLWIFGDVEDVSGFRKNQAHKNVIEFEDSGVVALSMKNGMLGGINWSVNSYQKNFEVSLTLVAEKGNIRIGGEYLNRLDYQLTDHSDLKIPEIGKPNDYEFYQGSMSNHEKVYDNLVKAMEDVNHPFTNAEDGAKTVALIERIYKLLPLQ